MGVPAGIPKTTRRPSHVAYYVALVGILSLLLMLCFYFCYFFIKKVRVRAGFQQQQVLPAVHHVPSVPTFTEIELSRSPSLTMPTTSCRPPPATAYPVQPEVRDSASAMAKLCKQVPVTVSGGGKLAGDTVHPTSTSPAALRTDTGDPAALPEHPGVESGPDRITEPPKPLPVAPAAAPLNMEVSAQ